MFNYAEGVWWKMQQDQWSVDGGQMEKGIRKGNANFH